ncbi:hypothetical protein KMZ93_15750 [Bradyrhizobium sediminis]|uniref:Uncharacterized protein n=1 Tax=Bradyrhizobium sediminis TaxID=2840469 RepID=A0A975NU71_9BRAD|nr:hypothetical protein [Bradyrhizobium sediminis]QWG21467.1 hypothetical protein KMZ93_15750 [Bradyrhizobium sediminis]
MQSTLKPREADPHDDFAIVPDVVPAAWADKVLADITGDTVSPLLDRQPPDESSAAAGTSAPTVDTTFRATDTDDVEVRGGRPSTRRWAATAAWAFMFALSSGLAVAAWQHYGDAAGQMISNWTPPFAVNSSPPPEQADTPSVQASAADQTAPQALAPAQPAESAAPAAAALAPDTAQLQAMARDVAAMGQQIEQLKASIDQLKASQQAISSDIAKTSATRTPATKSSERNVRPKMPPPPPLRSAAAPSRPPMPAYPSAPAAMAPLPQAAPPAAPPPAAVSTDDEPVLRPPMPLR